MKIKTNYHTHTTFCDGKNSPEEMIQAALEKGFSILGFSGHSMYPHAADWHIPVKNHAAYFAEIKSLSEKYRDRIKILSGLEADYITCFADEYSVVKSEFKPDYLIGSVHYIATEKGFFTVDEKAENVAAGIKKLFNGNGKKAVQEYFFLEREMLSKGGFEIIGHPDLVKIRNVSLNFFNPNESWYRKELRLTAKAISKAGVIAEINTGGIARKSIDELYPSDEFLALLHEYSVPVTISSDSHSVSTIDFAFDRAEKSAFNAGYTELAYLDETGIKMQKL